MTASAAVFAAICCAHAASNLLYNGNFEIVGSNGMPDGWTANPASGGGVGLFNAGTANNNLGEEATGTHSLFLVQNPSSSSIEYSVSQTFTATVPGTYRLELQTFPYCVNGKMQTLSEFCHIFATLENGTSIISLTAVNKTAYASGSPYAKTFDISSGNLGKPITLTIKQPKATTSATKYRAIDNVAIKLHILKAAAGETLTYANGTMLPQQSIYVYENAIIAFNAADGFETVPSICLWDGAKMRFDFANWTGRETTFATLNGFKTEYQNSIITDPLSRIELVNAAGVGISLSEDGKSITFTRDKKRKGIIVIVR